MCTSTTRCICSLWYQSGHGPVALPPSKKPAASSLAYITCASHAAGGAACKQRAMSRRKLHRLKPRQRARSHDIAHLHVIQRERIAQREVLVAVHVLGVTHKGLQRHARGCIAVHDVLALLGRRVPIPAASAFVIARYYTVGLPEPRRPCRPPWSLGTAEPSAPVPPQFISNQN